MTTCCAVCGETLVGWHDEDALCHTCWRLNFAGQELKPLRDRVRPRPLTRLGAWTWLPERGADDRDVHAD